MNNRQSGRRRGRGGQRPQGNGGNPNSGNRIDNRARGNAPQLLEKYKNLARDAQMQGDRVLTEYYLQFADHYFRVVSENRARYEESRPRRDEWQGDDADLPEGNEGEAVQDANEGEDSREPRNSERRERRPRRNNFRRDDEDDSGNGSGNEIEGVGTGALPVDLLPPAIGMAERVNVVASNDVEADEEEEAPRPRRRGRLATRTAPEDAAEA